MADIRTRVRLALWALMGKVDFTDDEEDEPDEDEVDEDDAFSNPLAAARCVETPTDQIVIRSGRTRQYGPLVAFQMAEGAEVVSVVVRPATARQLAAGVLDAADQADGTSPLLLTRDPA